YVLPRLLARSWPVLLLQVPSLALRPCRKRFTTRRPSSLTRRRCIRLSPIVQYSPLLPPVGVWAVCQSQCGRSPSQAGYPSSPWWPITPPPSCRPAGPSCTDNACHPTPSDIGSCPVLVPVSRAYAEVRGRSPTCYSPVRRSCAPKGLPA